MNIDVKKSKLRAVQYFFADGSFEFALGILFLILSIFFFTEVHVQGWFSAVIDGSLVLVLIAGFWLVNRLIRMLKQHITYPRTGYIKYQSKSHIGRGWRMVAGLAAGGLIGGIGAVLISNPHAGVDVLPVFTGAAFCLVLVLIGFRSRVWRMYLLAGLNLGVGILLGLARLGNHDGAAAFYLAACVILLVSGGLTLRHYLRTTSLPVQGEQP